MELASDHFDVRKMRAGYPYAFIFKEDDTLHPDYFIYEVDPVGMWSSAYAMVFRSTWANDR